jgi:MerR family transcriptional regulator, light-induced transcriptional regulator
VAAERTGLTPELLRVWERRYGAVRPGRSEGGHRLYSDAHIHPLRLLAQATAAGRAIGGVASLGDAELQRLVREDREALTERRRAQQNTPGAASAADPLARQAFELTMELDPMGLERLLRRSATVLGVPLFLELVLVPLLVRVGEAWHAGEASPAQEHLGSVVCRRVLTSLLHAAGHLQDAPVLVVTTPAGERHEMGALIAAVRAGIEGWRIVYLGPDLPAGDIASAAAAVDARAVALSFIAGDAEAAAAEVAELRGLLPPGMALLVGGEAASALPATPGVTALGHVDALPAALAALAGQDDRG